MVGLAGVGWGAKLPQEAQHLGGDHKGGCDRHYWPELLEATRREDGLDRLGKNHIHHLTRLHPAQGL